MGMSYQYAVAASKELSKYMRGLTIITRTGRSTGSTELPGRMLWMG